jgi:hypothetical protein
MSHGFCFVNKATASLSSAYDCMLATGACGLDGVCLTSPSYTKNTAPQIVLNTTILPATFNLTYSSNYTACAQGVLRSLAAPCEPGASANDRQDGNITSKVVACPSAGCKAIASLCTGTVCLLLHKGTLQLRVSSAVYIDGRKAGCGGRLALLLFPLR